MSNNHGSNEHSTSGATELMQLIVLTREYRSREEDLYYIDAPALDIVEAGHTPEKAHEVFNAALHYTVEGWLERGTLRSRLLELGYIEDVNSREKTGELLTTFCPPALSSARLLDDEDSKG
jgi:hypothetical protein